MKRTQVRALTLAILLTLTLCLLPTVAGAVTLSKTDWNLPSGNIRTNGFNGSSMITKKF